MRLRWLPGVIVLALFLGILLLTSCGEAEAPEATPVRTAVPSTTIAPPAIVIESPDDGDTVSVPVKVSGTASVFEGTLIVVMKDSRGNSLCRIVAQASEGGPGRGDFAVEFSFPPPTTPMEGRVEAYTESAKDGSVEDLVSVPVTVSADQPPIVLTSPQCNQEITSPLLVEGTASVFEGAIIIVVKDSAGRELARTPVQASGAAPERGAFSQEITFTPPDVPQSGTIEAFSDSPQDGSVINLFSMPVVLVP